MAYAYFTVRQGQALWPVQNGGELCVLFCRAFLLIAVTGPGSLAVEHLRHYLPGRPAAGAVPIAHPAD
ncbi:putative membrane protein YphA (DoxX/SURF4 family) [Kitasatospora sp. GP82]|nr:putative membrane protein YphA (DoxX/SURF4 family) [Kitasatospora sp. GP82]